MVERYSIPQAIRQVCIRPLDGPLEGINGGNMRGCTRITPGQTAVATADLLDMFSGEIDQINQGTNFVVF
jgi:hypothetical protein